MPPRAWVFCPPDHAAGRGGRIALDEARSVLLAAQPRVLTLSRRAITVPPRASALISRQRGQPHPVEQLRGLLVEHGRTVMRGSRTQVSRFDVKHALSLCIPT
jgi:hypothetical protein